MGEESSQIEQRITAERADLGRNLDELESRAREIADWRTHFRNHPGAAVGVAFGAGLALGMLVVPESDAAAPDDDGWAATEHVDEPYRLRRPHRLSAIAAGVGGDRAKQQIGDTWQRIADALLGVAAGRVVAFVGDHVPGFRERFDGAEPSRDASRDAPWQPASGRHERMRTDAATGP